MKINAAASICRGFLEGWCEDGIDCLKRHVYICPEFYEDGSCGKVKCRFSHVRRGEVCGGKRKREMVDDEIEPDDEELQIIPDFDVDNSSDDDDGESSEEEDEEGDDDEINLDELVEDYGSDEEEAPKPFLI